MTPWKLKEFKGQGGFCRFQGKLAARTLKRFYYIVIFPQMKTELTYLSMMVFLNFKSAFKKSKKRTLKQKSLDS